MHQIEPHYNWLPYYDSSFDENSPFHGKEYNYDLYSTTIYGYYIDPAWDYMGSETLYIKILYADYQEGYVVIEMLGEWNDAIENDIMHFKNNIVDHFLKKGVNKFILLGENILNFHGSDDCYYEEWFEEVEEGWIAALSFRDFIYEEWRKYHLDTYINFGGLLELPNWRNFPPKRFCQIVKEIISRRIELV
ncbi:MAG: hypothetical protein ACFB0B_13005 [Thermonemataceae bacterium]